MTYLNSRDSIAELIVLCHGQSLNGGWWHDVHTGEPLVDNPYAIATKLMLVNSEVVEAMEGFRSDKMDDHLHHRKMLDVELADAVIRIFDLCGALHIDLTAAIYEKLAYNARRIDHQPTTRRAPGGKKF